MKLYDIMYIMYESIKSTEQDINSTKQTSNTKLNIKNKL